MRFKFVTAPRSVRARCGTSPAPKIKGAIAFLLQSHEGRRFFHSRNDSVSTSPLNTGSSHGGGDVRLLDVDVLTTVVGGNRTELPFSSILLMKNSRNPWLFPKCAILAAITALASPHLAHAQFFNYAAKGDLMAGFRKPGVGTYELMVNLGNVTNFLALPPGTTISVTNFSPAQLTDAFPSYGNLQWSVFATFTGPPNSTWAGYQLNTVWFTSPRSDVNTQTTPPTRRSGSSQSFVLSEIDSIGKGAHTTSVNLGATNADNNAVLVRELASDPHSLNLGVFIANPQDSSVGDFGGNLPSTAENVTPSTFNSAVRSDLYQSVPTTFNDPNSGTSSGASYYVGYFTFNPAGTMTFTRGSSVVQAPPPPPQIVGLTRVGNTSTIFFTTTNGTYTYSLCYTNSTGLMTSVSNWSLSDTTVIGNGATNQLSDTTTDAYRFYRVSAH